jgi:APA family basic amino acid/polyamine antiporter
MTYSAPKPKSRAESMGTDEGPSGQGQGPTSPARPARRVVTRWEIVALSLNDVIGSGVYLLPASVAVLGPASPLAVVFAGVAVLLVVLCFAEAASRFEEPGGGYLYAREAWGEFWGFEVGWMAFLTRVAVLASLSAGLAQALGFLWPAMRSGAGRAIAIAVPLVLLTVVNVLGVKVGARTAATLLLAKLVPLVVFIALGLPAMTRERLLAPAAGDARLGEVALLLLFAYAGFENTGAAAGEFRDPKKDVPFALLTQIGLVTALYALVQLVAQGTLAGLPSSSAPLADAGRSFLGPSGGVLLTAGAVASILGSMGSTVVSGPRYLFALARDGFGPAFLAREDAHRGTPAAAIVTLSLLALPLALTGTFVGLASLSVIARLSVYVSTAAAVPVLRRKLPGTAGARQIPGGLLVPVGAVLVCVYLLGSATRNDLLGGAVGLVVGAMVFTTRRRPGSART